jgi:hypothetical protein
MDDKDGRKDFDFLFGGRWRIHNSRLARRLDGCTEWQELDADLEARPLIGGHGNVEWLTCARFADGKPLNGATVRVFDPGTRL